MVFKMSFYRRHFNMRCGGFRYEVRFWKKVKKKSVAPVVSQVIGIHCFGDFEKTDPFLAMGTILVIVQIMKMMSHTSLRFWLPSGRLDVFWDQYLVVSYIRDNCWNDAEIKDANDPRWDADVPNIAEPGHVWWWGVWDCAYLTHLCSAHPAPSTHSKQGPGWGPDQEGGSGIPPRHPQWCQGLGRADSRLEADRSCRRGCSQ